MKSSRMKKILAVILCLTLGFSTNMMTMAESVNSPAVESVQEDPAGSSKQAVQDAALQTMSVENTEAEAVQPTEAPVPTEAPTPEVTAEPTEVPVEETTPVPTETPAPEVTAEPTEAPVEETTPEIEEKFSSYEAMPVEDLYTYIITLSENERVNLIQSLSDAKQQELSNYGESIAANYTESTEESGEIPNTVNYYNAQAPIVMSENLIMKTGKQDDNFSISDAQKSDGLEIKKQVQQYGEGKGILSLETYVTGTVQKGESVPLDIVLVLDQSSSMKNKMNTGGQWEEIDKTRCKYSDMTTGSYYIEVEGIKYKLSVKTEGWIYKSYTVSCDELDVTYVRDAANTSLAQSSSEELRESPIYQWRTTGSTTRQEALKNAAKNFVSSVAEDAKEKNIDHRISVVGFAGGNSFESGWSGHDRYENTEILTSKSNKDINYSQCDEENIKNSMMSITTEGGYINSAISRVSAETTCTAPQYGMELAQKILENTKETGRKQIVILFTDGVPADYGTDNFNTQWASEAIEYANEIKKEGASVYTIGIFDGANPDADIDLNITTNANRYMQFVSSNYPDAINMQNGGQKAELDEGKSYYLSANNAEALDEVFSIISEEIAKPSVELGKDTVVQDVLSAYFQLPDGIGNDDIKVYQSISEDGGTSWGALDPAENIKIEIITTGSDQDTVRVSGFDFGSNFVASGHTGAKLVIQIPIEFDETACFGGNNIPTNEGTSGVYSADGSSCFGNYQIPQINQPINYQFTVKDQTIHLTTAADLTKMPDYAYGYTPNGINNKFVTIEYTLSDNSGAKVGTFKIPEGVPAENGTWTWENGKDANPSDLTECTDYFLTCMVSPSEDPTQTQFGTVAEDTKLAQQNATVHVLIPKINCSDTTVFIYDVVTLKERYDSDSIGWVDKNKDHTNSNVITTAPSVTVTPEYVSGTPLPAAGGYRPEEDSDFKLEVMAGGTNITENCHIIPQEVDHTTDCIRTDETEAEHDFTIHVVAGSIQINKEISGKINTKLEGNPVFTFRIVYQGQDGSTQTFYRTIEFEGDDKDFESAEILKGLPRGTYTVTELTTQKFKFEKLEIEDGTTCKATKADNSVTFEIGESTGENKDLLGKTAEVTFTNKKDGPSTNTDTDVVVNRFVFDEASNSWTVKQIWNPGEDQTVTIPNAGQTSSSGDNQ